MKLTVTRLGDGNYETLIKRDDGVTFRLAGVGRKFALPHDLAHFVVEQSLRLDRGFWGSVADGAVFGLMTHVEGRRKPRAAERSKIVMKANAPNLSEVEVMVGIFSDAFEQDHGNKAVAIHARILRYQAAQGQRTRTFNHALIEKAVSTWQTMMSQWNELPVGGKLELVWPR
jgi:hypothetical protein